MINKGNVFPRIEGSPSPVGLTPLFRCPTIPGCTCLIEGCRGFIWKTWAPQIEIQGEHRWDGQGWCDFGAHWEWTEPWSQDTTRSWKYFCLLSVSRYIIETAEYWRKVFLFIGLPIIGVVAYNTYLIEMAHFEHLEEHPVNQVPYEYLKIRSKVICLINIACVSFGVEILLGWWRQESLSQWQDQPLTCH